MCIRDRIKQNLIGAGNNNVTITLNQGDGEYWMDSGTPEGVKMCIRDRCRCVLQEFYIVLFFS